jgi:hypothetical protein
MTYDTFLDTASRYKTFLDNLQAMMGKRVRYEEHGMGQTSRVDTYDIVESPYSVVVEGEVRSWSTGWPNAVVEIAGYGTVDADKCTIIEEET